MLYTQSIVDLSKETVGFVSKLGYSVGMSLFYRRIGVPVLMIGISFAEKSDQETDRKDI